MKSSTEIMKRKYLEGIILKIALSSHTFLQLINNNIKTKERRRKNKNKGKKEIKTKTKNIRKLDGNSKVDRY